MYPLGQNVVLVSPDLLELFAYPGDDVCRLEDDGDLAGLPGAHAQPLPHLTLLGR